MAALDDLNIRDWEKLAKNLLRQVPAAPSSQDTPGTPLEAPTQTQEPEADGIPIIAGPPKKMRKEGSRTSWAGEWDR
jgi:hypothetical protein